MNPHKLILALALVFSSQQVLADDCKPNAPAGVHQITDNDVADALALLIEAGVIELKYGRIEVKSPSVLEKLREEGRVRVETASAGSICF